VSSAAPLSTDLELYVETGPQTGQRHPVPAEGQLTLGRGDDCDIRFSNEHQMMVSRRHARIQARDDGIFLTDLASGRGTRLNEQIAAPGKELVLHEGARIRLGLPDGPVLQLRAASSASAPQGTVLVNQPSSTNLAQQVEILTQTNEALTTQNQRLFIENQNLTQRLSAVVGEKDALAQKLAAVQKEPALRSSSPAEPSVSASPMSPSPASGGEWDCADELFAGFSRSLIDIKEALRGCADAGAAQAKLASAIFKLDNFRKYLQSLRCSS